MDAPTGLRVEHLDEPLGTTVRRPRLSWRLPAGARRQIAYRLRAGGWDSGRVDSDQSVLVPYAGPELVSGERVSWTVKVWTDGGESGWAEPGWWEMGLLDAPDWAARWIGPAEPEERRRLTPRPAYLVRGTFTVEGPVARARVYATAHGVYELFLNGHRLGDAELTPGFTSYRSRIQFQTFDVTSRLVPGTNAVGAVLSDGWYRGQVGGLRLTDLYGEEVALLAEVRVHGPDGALVRFATGADWRVTTGAIRAADLMEGQVVDFGEARAGWCRPEADLSDWSAVVVREHDLTRLHASPAPPVRRVQALRPVEIARPAADRQIVDFGQNINGWVRLTRLGPPGTTLVLTHGEALDAHGDITVDNIRPGNLEAGLRELPLAIDNLGRPLQVDRVTASGGAVAAFEPRHTTHGFRYVRIEGHPEPLAPADVTGIVVHTDMRRTGWFECSDDRLNRLHDAAVWSLRGNACDIPTDCPTRERVGWTGDWQLFVETAAFVYDVAGFSTKWLHDLALEQRSDGAVLHHTPDPYPSAFTNGPENPTPPGSAGWGDAAVVVPWEIYRAFGDIRLLENQWSSMCAWVDYGARAARERRHPSRAAGRPTPSAHEAFIWDSGFHWGDWLRPGEDLHDALRAAVEGGNDDVATAYLHRSARLLAQIAGIIGHREEAAGYDSLAAAVRAAWQSEFIRPDGLLTRDTQARYVWALAFGLAPQGMRPRLARRLVELIRANGTHLATGFLSTPYLLPMLADAGHLDVAYELLMQDSEPSWLTMIERGATTVWEAWDGINEHGVARLSLNHYSKGAVVSFLHRYVGGIRLLDAGPAYRRFRLQPLPGGGLDWARVAHESPYGRIECSWRLQGDRLTLEIAVPSGTTAEVCLPDGRCFEAQPGRATYVGDAG